MAGAGYFFNLLDLRLVSLTLLMGVVSAAALVASNGGIAKNQRYLQYLVATHGAIIIGLAARLSGITFGRYLLMAGFIATIIVYVLYYMDKKDRQILDHVKLGWVLTTYTTLTASVAQLGFAGGLAGASLAFLLGMMGLFIYQQYKSGKLIG